MTTQPTLRAILIAPETRTVSEIFIPQTADILQEYYTIIGNNCEIIAYGTSMIIDDVIIDAICDDDILLRTSDIIGGCWYNKQTEQATIIVNNVILVATNENGETINNPMTLEQAEGIIEWLTKEQAITYAEGVVEGGFDITVY